MAGWGILAKQSGYFFDGIDSFPDTNLLVDKDASKMDTLKDKYFN